MILDGDIVSCESDSAVRIQNVNDKLSHVQLPPTRSNHRRHCCQASKKMPFPNKRRAYNQPLPTRFRIILLWFVVIEMNCFCLCSLFSLKINILLSGIFSKRRSFIYMYFFSFFLFLHSSVQTEIAWNRRRTFNSDEKLQRFHACYALGIIQQECTRM